MPGTCSDSQGLALRGPHRGLRLLGRELETWAPRKITLQPGSSLRGVSLTHRQGRAGGRSLPKTPGQPG